MRFSLSKLLVAVGLVSVACAGMTLRTRWWAEGMVALTILIFAVAAMYGVVLRGRNRCFTIAFAVVGGLYLQFAFNSFMFTFFIETSLPNHLLLNLATAMRLNNDSTALSVYSQPAYYTPAPLAGGLTGPTTVAPGDPTAPTTPSPSQYSDPSAPVPVTLPNSTIPTVSPTQSSSNSTSPTVAAAQDGSQAATPQVTAPPSMPPMTVGQYLAAPVAPANPVMEISYDQLMNSSTELGRFFIIGNCVWAWFFALLAGWFCGYLYSKRESYKTA